MEYVNKKIKEMRLNERMTLKELSDKTELSVSFLSQIERGSSSLAITSLKKIADAFDVSMRSFFEEIKNDKYMTKKEEQKTFKVEGSNVQHVRLSGEFSGRNLEPMKVTLAPYQPYIERFSHPGEEFYYVLQGKVSFKIEDEEYTLSEGDTIHFPSQREHQWSNPTAEETVLISVLTPVIF